MTAATPLRSRQEFMGNFWKVSFFQLVNSASAFFANVLAARWLGPAAFGDFYFYLSVSLAATLFFDFGLTRTLLRYSVFHQTRGETRTKLGYYAAVLKLKTGLGAACLLLGMAAAWLWGGGLRLELVLGLITGFVASYCQLLAGVAQTEGNYAAYNTVLSFNTLRLLLLALLAAGGWMFAPALYGVFLAAPLLLILIPMGRLGSELFQAGLPQEENFYNRIIRFGKWMIVLALVETLYQRLDVLMVRGLTDAEQAGYYAGALAFFGVVTMLPSYSAVLIYPKLVEAQSRGDHAGLQSHYRFSTDMIASLAIPMALGLWAIAGDVVGLMLGGKFAASAPLFNYLAVYSLILGCHLNSGALFFAKDQPQLPLLITVSAMAALALGNGLLIPVFGIEGAGMALILAMVVSLTMSWGMIYKNYKIYPDLRHLAGFLVAGLVMAASLRWLPTGSWLVLAGKVALGAIIYGGALMVTGNLRLRGWVPQLAGAGD